MMRALPLGFLGILEEDCTSASKVGADTVLDVCPAGMIGGRRGPDSPCFVPRPHSALIGLLGLKSGAFAVSGTRRAPPRPGGNVTLSEELVVDDAEDDRMIGLPNPPK